MSCISARELGKSCVQAHQVDFAMSKSLHHCQSVLSSNELFALLKELIEGIGPEN